jgi:hypothetical protein
VFVILDLRDCASYFCPFCGHAMILDVDHLRDFNKKELNDPKNQPIFEQLRKHQQELVESLWG